MYIRTNNDLLFCIKPLRGQKGTSRSPMKKIVVAAGLLLVIAAVIYWVNTPGTVSPQKTRAIEDFLRQHVSQTVAQDYQRHRINISVEVTGVSIDTITKEETREFISYFVLGKVSYVIRGKRTWHDEEGNEIHLDPEQEITHWFTCGLLEDRYGELLPDKRFVLTFYADRPTP